MLDSLLLLGGVIVFVLGVVSTHVYSNQLIALLVYIDLYCWRVWFKIKGKLKRIAARLIKGITSFINFLNYVIRKMKHR